MSEPMTQEQFSQIMSRFDAQDASHEARFAAIDARFDAQDAANTARFAAIDNRFETLEANMMRKSDLYPAILTVQGFTIALIVGVTVILNATVGFG